MLSFFFLLSKPLLRGVRSFLSLSLPGSPPFIQSISFFLFFDGTPLSFPFFTSFAPFTVRPLSFFLLYCGGTFLPKGPRQVPSFSFSRRIECGFSFSPSFSPFALSPCFWAILFFSYKCLQVLFSQGIDFPLPSSAPPLIPFSPPPHSPWFFPLRKKKRLFFSNEDIFPFLSPVKTSSTVVFFLSRGGSPPPRILFLAEEGLSFFARWKPFSLSWMDSFTSFSN